LSTVIAQDELPMFAPARDEEEPATCPIQTIDAMPYEEMLRMVRRAPLTDPLFRGEAGRHFHAALKQKRHALPDDERAAISAKVGFR
jgi:hypothetical protein